MNTNIEKGNAGWYIVVEDIHSIDQPIKLLGPYTSEELANEELKEILACLPIHPTSSPGLSPQS